MEFPTENDKIATEFVEICRSQCEDQPPQYFFLAPEVTVAIFIQKACIRWRVGHNISLEIFQMKRVRSQGSLETIVVDIFPSQYRSQFNLTKCRTVKKSQFQLRPMKF